MSSTTTSDPSAATSTASASTCRTAGQLQPDPGSDGGAGRRYSARSPLVSTSPEPRPSGPAGRRSRRGSPPAAHCGPARADPWRPDSHSDVASARGSSSATRDTLIPVPITSAPPATSPRMPAHLRPSISTSLGHFNLAVTPSPSRARTMASPSRAPVQPAPLRPECPAAAAAPRTSTRRPAGRTSPGRSGRGRPPAPR